MSIVVKMKEKPEVCEQGCECWCLFWARCQSAVQLKINSNKSPHKLPGTKIPATTDCKPESLDLTTAVKCTTAGLLDKS